MKFNWRDWRRRNIPIDDVVKMIAGLGIPGLVFMVAMVLNPFAGGAAIVTALASLGGLYCHRKCRPLSKPRLWYTNNLTERRIRWQNEEDSPLSLKPKLFLKHSAVKVDKQNCVDAITSVPTNSQSGSSNFLRMQRVSLNRQISNPITL